VTGADLTRLVETIAESLRVWVKRGEVALTEDQIYERARNTADSVRAAFMVVPYPEEQPTRDPEWWTPLIKDAEKRASGRDETAPGPVPWHSWSCRCDRCDTAKRSVKS
jgi:hypothetical protein